MISRKALLPSLSPLTPSLSLLFLLLLLLLLLLLVFHALGTRDLQSRVGGPSSGAVWSTCSQDHDRVLCAVQSLHTGRPSLCESSRQVGLMLQLQGPCTYTCTAWLGGATPCTFLYRQDTCSYLLGINRTATMRGIHRCDELDQVIAITCRQETRSFEFLTV